MNDTLPMLSNLIETTEQFVAAYQTACDDSAALAKPLPRYYWKLVERAKIEPGQIGGAKHQLDGLYSDAFLGEDEVPTQRALAYGLLALAHGCSFAAIESRTITAEVDALRNADYRYKETLHDDAAVDRQELGFRFSERLSMVSQKLLTSLLLRAHHRQDAKLVATLSRLIYVNEPENSPQRIFALAQWKQATDGVLENKQPHISWRIARAAKGDLRSTGPLMEAALAVREASMAQMSQLSQQARVEMERALREAESGGELGLE